MSETPQPLNVIRPPDFIFKYRVASRTDPGKEVLHNQGVLKQGTFDFVGIKYPSLYRESDEFFEKNNLKREWFKYPLVFSVDENGATQVHIHTEYHPLTEEEEKMGGQLACFKDCPYPFKGHPFPEAFPFVNMAKHETRYLVETFFIKDFGLFWILFSLFPKKKKLRIVEQFLIAYVRKCQKAMRPYFLHEKFMTKYGQEIMHFTARMLEKWGVRKDLALEAGECLAAQIDWDNAYWMRIGDAFRETSKELMLEDPRKELKKIAELMVNRNPTDPGTAARLKKGIKALTFFLLVPRYRKIFKECIQESNFENFQFDKADEYHSWLYADYNYLGLPLEKRLELYKNYHTEHPPFPPRIMMQNQ